MTINLNFNPKMFIPKFTSKKEPANTNLKLTPQLTKDTVYFMGMSRGVVSDMDYKSVLDEQLASEPRPTFEKDLDAIDVTSLYNAKTRVSSLSRYLKEDMVGFVVPEYKTKGENKGGYQWFEKGAEYLLRGSKEGVEESDFKPVAKELYGLLATHDNYWKSPEFVDYLSTLKQTPAIEATISAVKDLNKDKDVSFTGETALKMYGYFSPMKAMDKILNDGCAYTGKSLVFDEPGKNKRPSPEVNASLEHIMPKSWGGPFDDANYMVTSVSSNSLRGDLGLIQYLKGASAQ